MGKGDLWVVAVICLLVGLLGLLIGLSWKDSPQKVGVFYPSHFQEPTVYDTLEIINDSDPIHIGLRKMRRNMIILDKRTANIRGRLVIVD